MGYKIGYFVTRNKTVGGIPRVIHKIWLGSKALPQKYVDLNQTWLDLNPHWYIRWWHEHDIKTIARYMIKQNYEWMQAATNQAERSDILRLEILRRYGGIYVDTDMECLKPIDSVIDRRGLKCFGGFECFNKLEGRMIVGTAILGCTPKHPMMIAACDQLYPAMVKSRETESETLWRIVKGSGPHFYTNVWEQFAEDRTVAIFAPRTFYPGFQTEDWRPYRGYPRSILRVIYPESATYHHWDNTWL